MFRKAATLWRRFRSSPKPGINFEIEINLDVEMAKAAITEMLKSEQAEEVMTENPYRPPELICNGLEMLAEEAARRYIRVSMRFK